MKRFINAILILILITGSSLSCAGDLKSTLGFLADKGPRSALADVIVKSDEHGNIAVAYIDGPFVYQVFTEDGSELFPAVHFSFPYVKDFIGVEFCRDSMILALHQVFHDSLRYALIDKNGNIVESGAERGASTQAFLAPDGNAVLWGYNIKGQSVDTKTNLPVFLQHGDAKVYALSPNGIMFAHFLGAHMPNDSSIFTFGYRNVERQHPYTNSRTSYDSLLVYKYDTWERRVVDSTSIPLANNPGIISYDLPFERVRTVNDGEGNMLVFASYIDDQTGPELRVIRLSTDLEVLPPPDFQITANLPSVDIPKGTEYTRLFWFNHDLLKSSRNRGQTLSLNQFVVTKDQLQHSKIYDIPSKF